MNAEATFIDTRGTVHVFQHVTDRAGDSYVWKDITGHQHAFMRNMSMEFGLWVSEVIRGIVLAEEIIG